MTAASWSLGTQRNPGGRHRQVPFASTGVEADDLPRQAGRVLLHCPLAKHWDCDAPSRRYPVLHTNLATSFRLN